MNISPQHQIWFTAQVNLKPGVRLTDVIQRPAAEFAVELLGSEHTEVTNGEGPQVENIVPGERLSLLQHHHLSPQQGQLDGSSQPTWPSTQHVALRRENEEVR